MTDLVEALARRQRTHPPLDGLPLAAQVGDLPLFVGELHAAQVRLLSSSSFTSFSWS